LPFQNNGLDDLDPYILMKIVPEFSITFNTKTRAPFKFVFEAVQLKEIK